jgi:hypothetical protein
LKHDFFPPLLSGESSITRLPDIAWRRSRPGEGASWPALSEFSFIARAGSANPFNEVCPPSKRLVFLQARGFVIRPAAHEKALFFDGRGARPPAHGEV